MSLGLAIVGYGKMGRLIEQFAPEYGFDVRAKFNSCNNPHGVGLTRDALRGVDVALEFSGPGAAVENILWLSAAGVNAVVGTTGWFDRLAAVRDAVEQGKPTEPTLADVQKTLTDLAQKEGYEVVAAP